MVVEYITGHYSMLIDGAQFVDLTKEQQVSLVHKLVNIISDEAILQEIVERVCESEGNFEDLGYCETCGDSIEKYTLTLNDK